MSNAPRMSPAAAPFPSEVQAALDRTMPPGVAPLTLFTTLARDPRLFKKFFGGGLLDKGNLSMRQREIVIHRVTAQSGGRYEFCVHVAFFAGRVGLDDADVRALAYGPSDDPRWPAEERTLLALCDSLHATCDVDDGLWSALRTHFSEEAVLELIMLAGFYRTTSTLVTALRLAPEPFAPPYPEPL
ncbi:MAG: carboxymuconolactone decarboxylase family protein [Hyphomonadaceae bacterium]|nr:carboxymuconolactone decarboxylase family protein [Hyphomonadaceae bacterium]